GPGMPTLGPYAFNDARSESSPAHPAMHRAPHGTPPIARTRQGYDHAPGHAPAIGRSEPAPRFEPHELEGNVSLQPSNRLLYLGIGVVLVGIIVLLAVSIADNRDEAPAASRPSLSQGSQGSGGMEPPAAGSAVLPRPEAGHPEAVRTDSTAPA